MTEAIVLTLRTFVIPMLMSFFKHLLFDGDVYWQKRVFITLKDVVRRSENKIDDVLFLPILEQIEQATIALKDEGFVMGFLKEFLTEISSKEKPSVWIDTIFDFLEEAAIVSTTKWDDKIILPMIYLARKKLGLAGVENAEKDGKSA